MHRSKRNRARDFDARGRGTGRRFVLSYPIESSPDERTIYMVHRVESVSINTHDRRNEPGRLVFSSHPLPIYPCFHKNPRFQNFYSLPSIAPSLHLSFYISSIPRPARSTNLAPRGREFVRDSSKLPVRTFVEIRGRYTIKFPEAKNTNRAPTFAHYTFPCVKLILYSYLEAKISITFTITREGRIILGRSSYPLVFPFWPRLRKLISKRIHPLRLMWRVFWRNFLILILCQSYSVGRMEGKGRRRKEERGEGIGELVRGDDNSRGWSKVRKSPMAVAATIVIRIPKRIQDRSAFTCHCPFPFPSLVPSLSVHRPSRAARSNGITIGSASATPRREPLLTVFSPPFGVHYSSRASSFLFPLSFPASPPPLLFRAPFFLPARLLPFYFLLPPPRGSDFDSFPFFEEPSLAGWIVGRFSIVGVVSVETWRVPFQEGISEARI